jgi:predicted small secreted protein
LKKLFCFIVLFTLILSACNSTELSIHEIQNVPNKVQDVIDSDYTLQLIRDGKKNAYVTFQSTGTVTANLEVIENILNININSETEENNELKQNVFKLTRGNAEYDTINVLVNGKDTPFDNATGF